MAKENQASTNQIRAVNIPAIERATGRTWEAWIELFDARDGRDAARPKNVTIARDSLPDDLESPDWWAQGTVIAYEQHIGGRVPGQSATGLFHVGNSPSFDLDRDEAIAAWIAAGGSRTEHLGYEIRIPLTATTARRSFWRRASSAHERSRYRPRPNPRERQPRAVPRRPALFRSHRGVADALEGTPSRALRRGWATAPTCPVSVADRCRRGTGTIGV